PVDSARPAMGGVLLWHDLRNFVRLDRGARGLDEISFMGCIDGKDAIFGRGRLPGDDVRLRLERTGQTVRALCSADGVDWFSVGSVELADVAPWEAGIFAVGYVDRALYPGTPAGGGALRFASVSLWSPAIEGED
ncbi:MAG: hypothetical protein KDE20_21845, partial [Caldilineaceae bacterium]|nr:hypothetical protein [Caldilineaceae bacterium]